jgi:hypothetical protein
MTETHEPDVLHATGCKHPSLRLNFANNASRGFENETCRNKEGGKHSYSEESFLWNLMLYDAAEVHQRLGRAHCFEFQGRPSRSRPVQVALHSRRTHPLYLIAIARTPSQVNYQLTPWLGSASELHRPNDRRLSAKLVPSIAVKGCYVVSHTAVFSPF